MMIDMHSPSENLTIGMPADLVAQLRLMAAELNLTLDALILEACLAQLEPHIWERCYNEWRQSRPEIPVEGERIAS